MPKSVIDAIKRGNWKFEPEQTKSTGFCRTNAMPGSPEKLNVLAKRLENGEPLWHPEDRIMFLEVEREQVQS